MANTKQGATAGQLNAGDGWGLPVKDSRYYRVMSIITKRIETITATIDKRRAQYKTLHEREKALEKAGEPWQHIRDIHTAKLICEDALSKFDLLLGHLCSIKKEMSEL